DPGVDRLAVDDADEAANLVLAPARLRSAARLRLQEPGADGGESHRGHDRAAARPNQRSTPPAHRASLLYLAGDVSRGVPRAPRAGRRWRRPPARRRVGPARGSGVAEPSPRAPR